MSLFKRAVNESVAAQSRTKSHPIRGIIPQGAIDQQKWTCTVRIPHVKGAIHPTSAAGTKDYLEFQDVPIPKNVVGILVPVLTMVDKTDRAVMVGFSGGGLSFPFVMSIDTTFHALTDQQTESVMNRNPRTPTNFTTAGKANPSLGSRVSSVLAETVHLASTTSNPFLGPLNFITRPLIALMAPAAPAIGAATDKVTAAVTGGALAGAAEGRSILNKVTGGLIPR